MKNITIGARTIGPGRPAYLIAEISANHHQDFDHAVRLIHAIKAAGADAVKLQTYTPDTLTIDCDRPEFRIGGGTIWDGRKLYDLYAEAFTPWEWQPKLKAVADELGLDLFSTPFDASAVDFLEAMDVQAHKIASFEVVDLDLIRRVADTILEWGKDQGYFASDDDAKVFQAALSHHGRKRAPSKKPTASCAPLRISPTFAYFR